MENISCCINWLDFATDAIVMRINDGSIDESFGIDGLHQFQNLPQ